MTDPTDPTASDGPSPPGWVAFTDAAAAADVTHAVLAAALADGDVSFTTRLAGHEGVPMLRLADVIALRAVEAHPGS